MFTSIVFTTVLASSVLMCRAEVTPNEPGPGESFNEGATCHIGWAGDVPGSTAWANMAIELMTGSNEKMVHITTVAQNQDGTQDGTFDYPCPTVTPNSPIYFYQFTSGGTPNITWTTRFTIAGTDGSSTPATQTEQADGQTVAFGTGALVDPSTAVPPPTFNSSSSGSSALPGGSNASGSSSASSAQGNTASNTGGPSVGTSAGAGAAGATKAAGQTSASGNSGASNSASAPKQSGSSAAVAVGPMVLDTRMWPFVAALTACAAAFTILL